jgi:hypothetical protein
VRHSDRTAHGKIHRGLPRHSSGQRLEPRAADEKSGMQIATLRLESSGERVERPRRRQIVSGGSDALNLGKEHLQISHSLEHVLDTPHCRLSRVAGHQSRASSSVYAASFRRSGA